MGRSIVGGSIGSNKGGIALVLFPLVLLLYPDLVDDLTTFLSVPRPCVGKRASTLTVALASKAGGQVFGRDLLEELVLVLVTENLDLVDGDGVEPALDDGPDSGEDVGRVDDVELAHRLRVVVLTDVGGLLNVSGDLPELRDTDVLKVHDGAGSLDELLLVSGADGKTFSLELFVLDDELLDLTFWSGDLVKSLEIELAELLNVDRTTVFVSLVVVLGIVLIDLLLFGVLERVVKLLDLELGPPLFGLGEHGLCGWQVPLSSTKEATQAGIVVTLWVEEALLLDDGAELVERLLLGGVEVAWTTTLCCVGHWMRLVSILLASLRGVLIVSAKHSFLIVRVGRNGGKDG